MLCPRCSAESPSGQKFCGECGGALALACPSCRTVNPPGQKFCGECGTALAVAAVPSVSAPLVRGPAARPGPAAERRLVSVLFMDLVGFTALSESRDPEEVRELLSRYFDSSRSLIQHYGGLVEKFIGDAVMAVWGTPVANEDDAERAVRAALDLVEAVSALGQEIGAQDLKARAGVLTGEAAVNLEAAGQGMVAGDLVNTASRIQAAADPGSVYVGEATKRSTEAAVAYEDAGLRELRGKAEPVQLWRALRVVGGIGGALRSEGPEAPFVGRDRELRLVKEMFHASADEGKAHLVAITGIAGIGKSRLAWEFFKYIDGLARTVLWHRGRCLAYGEGVAYWALSQMVKSRAGVVDDDEPAAARAKLAETLAVFIPGEDERRWAEPRLAQLIGADEQRTHERDSLFAAWRLFFERLSADQPVVLVFEDLQWADGGLMDFIEHIVQWSRDHPIFILALARPELADKRPDWGAGGRNFTSLSLGPISADAMARLLAGLVPGLPEQLRDGILQRAEGVPLYAVETVRMLIGRGLLTRGGTTYRVAEAVPVLEIPDTLHALIAARLDSLTPAERSLIQNASVLGKRFTRPALTHVAGTSLEALLPVLASLVRKEILSVQADPRSPERGQYGFLQDLVRRVAYERMPKRERKVKHLAAAEYLATSRAEDEGEIAEILASHYLEAYAAAPDAPDAPTIQGRARETLTQAGDRAGSLGANGEAQRYFEQAAGLEEDQLARARLLERAGQAAYVAGSLGAARTHYDAAAEAFRACGDVRATARLAARRGDVDFDEGRLTESIDRMEQAFAVLSQDEPDEDLATLAATLGKLHFFKGNVDSARSRLETALDIAEPLALPEVISQALNTKGVVGVFHGRVEEALPLLRHALEIAVEHGLSTAALRAYVNMAELLHRRDRYEESLEKYQEGITLARRVGNRLWEVPLLGDRMFPLFVVGRWHEALQSAAEIPEADLARADTLGPVLALPAIHVAQGNLPGAQHVLSVCARFESSEDIQERSAYAVGRAVVLRAEGRLNRALEAADEAISLGRRIGPDGHMFKMGLDLGLDIAFDAQALAKVEEILAAIAGLRPGEITPSLRGIEARARARLAVHGGEPDLAESMFKSATAMFRELGMPFWVATTLSEQAEWLRQEGRAQQADQIGEEAAALFERLEAQALAEASHRDDATGSTALFRTNRLADRFLHQQHRRGREVGISWRAAAGQPASPVTTSMSNPWPSRPEQLSYERGQRRAHPASRRYRSAVPVRHVAGRGSPWVSVVSGRRAWLPVFSGVPGIAVWGMGNPAEGGWPGPSGLARVSCAANQPARVRFGGDRARCRRGG
jgi:class 3 adenylate cyclase/tetratricopeptide (TPR) repeat protein